MSLTVGPWSPLRSIWPFTRGFAEAPPLWSYHCPLNFPLALLAMFLGSGLRVWYVPPSLELDEPSPIHQVVRSFRALGRLFTYEIALRKGHSLITHGPYAWVRHPGYTGLYLTFVGLGLIRVAPNTWIHTHLLSSPTAKFFSTVSLSFPVFVIYGIWKRLSAEDKLMKNAFGKEWEEYARGVPWKLVPYVY